MGLRVYKADEASRDYENDFFREFSSNLVKMFDDEGLDGILIGHPNVPRNKYLKPDCVLITSKRLVLIDFKNHDGKIWLPEGDDFENSIWRHDGVPIAGGTSINPFEQLKKQKGWIEDLIGAATYGRYGIACVVCFQGDMTVMNKVPGKFQPWFSVTNSYQYINRIRDIIGINGSASVDIDAIFSYFDAKPYHDYYSVSLENMEAVSKANERSERAKRREYAAKKKVKELEKRIKEAESEKGAVTTLRTELEKAKQDADEAKRVADIAKSEFDEKKNALELEKQKAIKAVAEADKAKSEKEKAKIEADASIKKSRTKLVLAIVVAICLLVTVVVWAWAVNGENSREDQRIADEKAALEEDYKNGRKCIPVERVADFLDSKGVCVDFYANYINDSKNYVFADNSKNGTFALVISKDLLSVDEANAVYSGKHLEARGTITKYNDTYEIKITNLNQIRVLDE